MTDHPGDNADNRFRAFWAGFLGFVSFGIVLMLALKAFGPDGEEAKLTAVDQQIVEARKSNLTEVLAAQSALVAEEALESAVAESVTALAEKKAGKTELVVPNSPTFIKQMTEAQQTGQADAPDETGAGETAATEKPAEKKPEN